MLFSDLSTEGLTSLDLVVRDSGDLYESGGCVILGESRQKKIISTCRIRQIVTY